MKTCYKCGAHAEVSPCPACRRNQELERSRERLAKESERLQERLATEQFDRQRRIAERNNEAQRRISEAETEERRRIAADDAVRVICQRLMDIGISQRSAPEHAVEDARILMSLPDFKKHLSEVWEVVAGYACLKQAYFRLELASLLKGGCPDDVVRLIRNYPFLRDPAMKWLREEAGDNWSYVGAPAFERVLIAIDQLDQEEARLLAKRQQEQQREREREERRCRAKIRWQRVFAFIQSTVVIVGLLLLVFWFWNRSGSSSQQDKNGKADEASHPPGRASASSRRRDGATTADTPAEQPIEVRRALPVGQEPQPLKPLYDTHAVASFVVSGLKINDTLNVRTGPSAKHPVVATLSNGKRGIQIVGEPVQNGETLWVLVRLGDVTGWVNRQFLVEE